MAQKKMKKSQVTFFFGKDFKNNFNYSTFDLGLKLAEVEFLQSTGSALLFFPKVEWHKDGSNKEKLKNTLSGGINMEFFPIRAATSSTSGGLKLAPLILGSLDYQNDYIKKVRSIKPKAFLSFFSSTPGLPSSSLRHSNNAFFFRYYLYTGYEYYKNSETTRKKSSYWSSRLFSELYPIPSLTGDYLQITVDYTYRVKLKDNQYTSKNLEWLSLGINIYPDGQGKLGFGLEYSKGDDPNNNFVDTDKLTFGLKIKL